MHRNEIDAVISACPQGKNFRCVLFKIWNFCFWRGVKASAVFINNSGKKMRRMQGWNRPNKACSLRLFFDVQKNGQNRSIFPVMRRIFPLLNRDFRVQLTVLKMPVGLYKIPALYSPLFPKIERT
jgi:hypothetical protein